MSQENERARVLERFSESLVAGEPDMTLATEDIEPGVNGTASGPRKRPPKAPIERFGAHAPIRGWQHARLLSSAGTTYNRDYHAEAPDGAQFAMLTTFVDSNGVIRHFWSSEGWHVQADPGQNERHVDFMWPLWGVLDRTAHGRGTDWMPQLAYS